MEIWKFENMSKEELIQELTNINSSFVNNVNAKLSDFSERFNKFTSKIDAFLKIYLFSMFDSQLIDFLLIASWIIIQLYFPEWVT